VALVALVATLLAATLVEPSVAQPADGTHATAKPRPKDPRKTQGLFVDTRMPAANQEKVYADAFGKKAQALWLSNDYYRRTKIRNVVTKYIGLAEKAGKIPMLVVYSIPDRDCGGQSQGGLPGADAYRAWIREVVKGLRGSKALLILEPDALPFYGSAECDQAGDRLGLLHYASKTIARTGTWVYIDAGHSDWRPYDDRALLLKRAGIEYARGFSTNVSNFRSTSDEQKYAQFLLSGLRKLGVKGKHYVIDTSRNGAANPVGGDVLNPTWARVGKKPKLVFEGGFDGTLWVKHPGESDGEVNGGNSSGRWCDLLADRLLEGWSNDTSCPE
jgi:endoglucanase